MQATVERALERGIPENADILPWMFRVCRNLWIDEIRAREVRVRAAQSPDLAIEPAVSGEKTAIGEITLREVEAALAELPEDQRAVVSLVAIEGMSYREAAATLDAPIGTIMSRLSRARATLAARFGDRADGPSAGGGGTVQ